MGVTDVKSVFKMWKKKCPYDDIYKMRLLYHKMLGDCSETIDIENMLNEIRNLTCNTSVINKG
jgi:hypothetical protein